MVDDHEMQLRVLELFRQGKRAEASALQDEFLELVKSSGVDYCNCPTACKFHGDCFSCVITHRGHGDHLPHCLHKMINRKLEELSQLSEHSFKTPDKP